MPGTIVEEESDGPWWEAQKIVADRVRSDGQKEYRVRWVGCTIRQDTWETEDNLADSLYDEYHDQLSATASKRKSKSTKRSTKKQKVGINRALWTVPDGDSNSNATSLLSLGNLTINTLCSTSNPPLSFNSYYFGRRIVTIEAPLNRSGIVPPKQAIFGGYTLQLLSSRIPNDSKTGKHRFVGNQRIIRFTYVATKGPGLSEISLEDKLLSIADFKSLSPHKAKARLELLDSGTNSDGQLITKLSRKDFKIIKDEGHLGCGFIPNTVLEAIGCKPNVCIQVRVVSPQLGIFKGVLCPKRDSTTQQIELPRSMQKVRPSKLRPRGNFVCLIVKTTFPTTKNIQLGRQLDSNSKPCLSAFTKRDRGPGEMIERLLLSHGVAQSTIRSYVKRCNKRGTLAGLKHAYLLGVKDPTGQLPKGSVFVRGIGDALDGNHIFITRSPCVEHSDGRLVPVVTKKPSRMSKGDWKWLSTEIPFGIVIFGAPQGNMAPLPELIAGGDLDGDTYFVCWDNTILQNVESAPMLPDSESECRIVQNTKAKHNKEGWLSASQDVMLNIDWHFNVKQLNGKLWALSKKAADNSSLFMKDDVAVQMAQAYKLSLDLSKQGGSLFVPECVRNAIPKSLHGALAPPDETATKKSNK